jgi:hypothetical protein
MTKWYTGTTVYANIFAAKIFHGQAVKLSFHGEIILAIGSQGNENMTNIDQSPATDSERIG